MDTSIDDPIIDSNGADHAFYGLIDGRWVI